MAGHTFTWITIPFASPWIVLYAHIRTYQYQGMSLLTRATNFADMPSPLLFDTLFHLILHGHRFLFFFSRRRQREQTDQSSANRDTTRPWQEAVFATSRDCGFVRFFFCYYFCFVCLLSRSQIYTRYHCSEPSPSQLTKHFAQMEATLLS